MIPDSDDRTGYSHSHQEQFDERQRLWKAKKIVSVLLDFLPNTRNLDLLEMGCSAGFATSACARHFRSATGIDLDEAAVEFARRTFEGPNLSFQIGDALHTDFPNESFDVIVCNHVYEHVENAEDLMKEIERVLKPGGVCYFGAGNRLILIEPDNRLPFLSILPRPLANAYVRLTGRGNEYHERLYTCWGLRKLVKAFDVVDYTPRIVEEPETFAATDMLLPGSFKQKMAAFAVRRLYCLFPTYIWLLIKKKT